MNATVLIEQDAFALFADNTPIGPRRALDADALTHLTGLSARYGLLGQRPDPAAAFAIGRDLYRWIDGDQRQLGRLLEEAPRPLVLDIHCPGRSPGPAQWALLQAPWELLANEAGYLAVDALLQFSPQRRVGPLGEPPPWMSTDSVWPSWPRRRRVLRSSITKPRRRPSSMPSAIPTWTCLSTRAARPRP